MSEWAKTLLADVARETIAHISFESEEHEEEETRIVVAVVQRRLLGLLEAGEAMWDKVDGDGELGRTKEWEAWEAWEAAKSAAMKEPG